jgi:flagellar protein FlaJ
MRAGSKEQLGFWGASYVLYSPYVSSFESLFAATRSHLAKSGMRVTFRAYVAGALFSATLAGIAGALAGFTAAYYGGFPAPLLLLFIACTGILGYGGALIAFYILPSARARSRGLKLDSELPYAVGHMSVLSTAGVTPERIFEALAREPKGGVVNQEAKTVVRDMSALGMDLGQAIDAAIKRSPSRDFEDFLDGFGSASTTGRDLRSYLNRAASALMLDKRIEAKAVGDNVGLVAEVYSVVLVVAPLLLIIMFSMMGAIVGSIAGLNIVSLMYIIAYFFVPVGGAASLILADQTVRKEVD